LRTLAPDINVPRSGATLVAQGIEPKDKPMSDAAINETEILSRMDDSKITRQHWKVMFISGVGFFTDASLRRTACISCARQPSFGAGWCGPFTPTGQKTKVAGSASATLPWMG
jgi:hypothetical protein